MSRRPVAGHDGLMLAMLVAGAAACGPPMKQTPVEEIPKLTKLDDECHKKFR